MCDENKNLFTAREYRLHQIPDILQEYFIEKDTNRKVY